MTEAVRHPHPEAGTGEVCIGNIYGTDFAAIGWSTKRMGVTSLDRDRRQLKGGNMKPVFVARLEIEAAGIEIPAIGVVDHKWRSPQEALLLPDPRTRK